MFKFINTLYLHNNLKETTSYVHESKKPLIITKRGVPTSVLVSIDEYEDFLESRNTEYLGSVKKAREQICKGQVFSMEAVFGTT